MRCFHLLHARLGLGHRNLGLLHRRRCARGHCVAVVVHGARLPCGQGGTSGTGGAGGARHDGLVRSLDGRFGLLGMDTQH